MGRPRGRPTTFDAKKADQICAALSKGNFLQDACALVGLPYSTVKRWIERGQKSTVEPFHTFAINVAHARAQHTHLSLEAIQNGENWQAKAWLLEKLRPAQFAGRVRVHVENEIGGFLDRLKEALPAKVYEQVLAVAAAEPGGDAPPGSTGGTGSE